VSRRHLALLALCALTAWPAGAHAGLIRLVDEDGVVIYTDNPWQFDVYRRQLDRDADGEPGATRGASGDGTVRGESAGRQKAESAAEEIMRLTGLNAHVEILSMVAQDEFERSLSRFRRSKFLKERVAFALDPGHLGQELKRQIARRLDRDRTAILLTWLRSPLSRRIVALETTPPSPDRAAVEATFVNELPVAPPAVTRLALIHRVDRASEATETSAAVMAATATAIRRAIIPTGPGSMARHFPAPEREPINPTALDETLRFRTVASLLFTYRELDDRDLARYAAFLESPTGRWFSRITRAAFVDALLPARPGEPVKTARQ